MKQQGLIETDGAKIYFERRGSGPPLLLVSGGDGNANVWDDAAADLARDYTVIAYDRRGHSRSAITTPHRRYSVLQHANDAAAVISGLGFESVLVIGTSAGAVITLELAAAHPERIVGAIAYEPPVTTCLPERGELLDWWDRVHALARAGETNRAFVEFIDGMGLAEAVGGVYAAGSTDPSEGVQQMLKQSQGNLKLFLCDEVPGLAYFHPDYATLRSLSDRVILAAGDESMNLYGLGKPAFYALSPQIVAERIEAEFIQLSGHHAPYRQDAARFASEVRPMLAQLEQRRS